MDHFPTNWGRPVSRSSIYLIEYSPFPYRQRNDAYDPYGTYPIPQRPNNRSKDGFAESVQRTQYRFP